VDIGPALAEARSKAGMTIEEVSQRTRIRGTLISDIERDDYSACGGHFYTRGHIRAIARAVGTDPAPLIEEYDGNVAAAIGATQAQPDPEPATGPQAVSPEPPAAARPEGAGAAGPPRVPAADRIRESVAKVQRASADAGRRSAPRVRRAAADALQRITRLRATDRRWSLITGVFVIVLAGLILLIYLLVSGSAPGPGHAGSAARRGAAATSAARTGRPASGRPAPTPSRTSHAPGQPTVPLRPLSAAAFGPGGTAQGDNPQLAPLALSGRAGRGWQTNWYTTADFGGLQSGTGLLLDMGRAVTVTGARIELGAASGGALQLRAGNQPVLPALSSVSGPADARGTLTLTVSHPVQARYLLIWFTRLPPDSAGTYQATIYHVSLTGTDK
jgi:transcriptional regulator with XRE-family HTH domain